jgi:hypothetical protein
MPNVIFHCILWKKQPPNACFNLFLVLLLSPDSVADYVIAPACKKTVPILMLMMHNKNVYSKFFYE